MLNRHRRNRRLLPLAALVALAMCGTAFAAFQSLPASGSQVNDDPAAGIQPNLSVSGEDPANADVVGGALTAGARAVPWAIFRQLEAGGAHDQVFVRAFGAGAWSTKGAGTVSGRSSASPTFSGSLNFDQAQDGEAPAIDFAGAGRTVPWATWYEDTTGAGFGAEQIFASRFDNSGDANQGKWLFAGQSRGLGGGTVPIPSLNIHITQDAENPSVAGGSTSDPSKPGPWVTWQETATAGAHPDQIFVEKPIGPGATSCVGVTPAAADPTAVPVGGFCWQQVGVERLGADPSLNVDTTRNGVEPDIAFTGPNDSVPWVVWYERGTPGAGLHANELVFAAKGTAPATPTGAVDGGLAFTAVGSVAQGVLDASAGGGTCGASATAEGQCSLNSNPANDAEDPRVAGGSMNPANPTVPWVAWDETVGGARQIFVSRLVGTHFVLANGGAPISSTTGDSTRPDITFSGNTPYVTWRTAMAGGIEMGFAGHFVNPANPTFVLDASNVPLTPTAQADVREPVSSSCIATPFDGDGASCQGSAIGTPFFLFTNGGATQELFSQAYDIDTPSTGVATGVTTSSVTLTGSVNPEGGASRVAFQYGATTSYGQMTTTTTIQPANAPVTFTGQIDGLAPSSTLHYRAVASSDFGVKFGPDQTVSTAAAPAPPPNPPTPPPVNTTAPSVKLKIGGSTLPKLIKAGVLKVGVTVSEAATVRATATITKTVKHKKKVVSIGKAVSARFAKAGSKTLTIRLTAAGKSTLRALRKATIRLTLTATSSAGKRTVKVSSLKVKRP
jgi:hypothetical protein